MVTVSQNLRVEISGTGEKKDIFAVTLRIALQFGKGFEEFIQLSQKGSPRFDWR